MNHYVFVNITLAVGHRLYSHSIDQRPHPYSVDHRFTPPFESIPVFMNNNNGSQLLKTLCIDNKECISFHLNMDTFIQDSNLPIWRMIFQPALSFNESFNESLQLYSSDKHKHLIVATCKEYMHWINFYAEIHII